MKFRYFSRIFSKRWINSHFWCQELFLVEFFSCTTNWVKWLLLFMKISKGYVFKIFNQLIEITAWGKASLSSWRDFSFSVPVISWHLLKRWDCGFFWTKYPPSRSVIVFGELSFFKDSHKSRNSFSAIALLEIMKRFIRILSLQIKFDML